jgi:phosphoserine phosphatase
MDEILYINMTGEERPSILTDMAAILSRYDVAVLDIGHSVIHNTLSLGMLVSIPDRPDSVALFHDLTLRAHELELTLKMTPVSGADYEAWVSHQGLERNIVTVLGRHISASHIVEISRSVAEHGLNIDGITRLTGRLSLFHPDERQIACIEISVRGASFDPNGMRAEFMRIAMTHGIDIAFQKDDGYRRVRRLIAFDMDSTLIQAEVIDELAKAAGVGERVAAITERAMRGEIDFRASFAERVSLLKGLDVSVLKNIAENLPITEGADRLIRNLKAYGYKIAILSGGFDYFGNHLKERWGIDYVHTNILEIEDGKVTGRVRGDIVDGKRKAELLAQIAEGEVIRLEQVIAVGDGANDLPMLNLAGLGIAFHAKPIVKEGARHSISTIGLDGVLYFLGLRDRDIHD